MDFFAVPDLCYGGWRIRIMRQLRERYSYTDFRKELEERLAEAPEVPDRDHLQTAFGDLIEYLTGGWITSEEATRLNPGGGYMGPGESGVPVEDWMLGLGRHSRDHDGRGHMGSEHGVGPGYSAWDPGTMTTGQIGGILRELILSPFRTGVGFIRWLW